MEELIGKTLGQYQIIEKIGEGGMAAVFKAYQPNLNRWVAVKVLSLPVAEKKGFTERFQREAQAVARLNHPNILPVYDSGVQAGYNYIVMRYVEHSQTLGHLMEAGTPFNQLINYIIQVADALSYAHEQGIIHRDIKPSNILIDGKWALLSDFGLVKMTEDAAHLTGTGFSMGTPAYMSPEQVDGIAVDYRTDIYALGVILYKILTGTIPHDAPTPVGILVKRKSEPVPPLRKIKPAIPESLEQVTLRSLAMNPDKRYRSATDFAEALQKAQTNPTYREKLNGSSQTKEAVTQLDDMTLPHIKATAPRLKRSLIAGGVIAAVVVVSILVLLLYFLRNNKNSLAGQSSLQLTPSTTATPATVAPTSIPDSTPQGMTHTKLEIRSGPGEVYDLLGYLPAGITAEITGRDETAQWWQIKTTLASGVGWIKAGSNFSTATNAANMPIALAPPTPTSPATPIPDTPVALARLTPDLPTTTPTPLPPTPTPGGGLVSLTLWGSSFYNSLGGSGREQWFTFNSSKENEAALIFFIRNVERVEIFVYQGKDIGRWPPAAPNAIPNLGIASEQGNRDKNDQTREFVWQGPVTPQTSYYVRMVNWGRSSVQYCLLTRPDKDNCP